MARRKVLSLYQPIEELPDIPLAMAGEESLSPTSNRVVLVSLDESEMYEVWQSPSGTRILKYNPTEKYIQDFTETED